MGDVPVVDTEFHLIPDIYHDAILLSLMLYAGLGGGAGAFIMLILGLAIRRR